MKQATLGELVKYVLANRRGKAFLGYTELHIAKYIQDYASHHIMRYTKDDDDKITGIVLAELMPDHLIFVHDILTSAPNSFKQFVHLLRSEFSGYKLQAIRWKMGNEPTTYKVSRLVALTLRERT